MKRVFWAKTGLYGAPVQMDSYRSSLFAIPFDWNDSYHHHSVKARGVNSYLERHVQRHFQDITEDVLEAMLSLEPSPPRMEVL